MENNWLEDLCSQSLNKMCDQCTEQYKVPKYHIKQKNRMDIIIYYFFCTDKCKNDFIKNSVCSECNIYYDDLIEYDGKKMCDSCIDIIVGKYICDFCGNEESANERKCYIINNDYFGSTYMCSECIEPYLLLLDTDNFTEEHLNDDRYINIGSKNVEILYKSLKIVVKN